jgi:Domain of unknown function (DUF4301)
MLDETDRAQLAELGIAEDEVARQVGLFAHPPHPAALVRPCTVGAGIELLEGEGRRKAQQAYRGAAQNGRLLKFVPASGAATRMFQSLLAVRQREGETARAGLEARAAAGDGDSREALTFLDNLSRFPFVGALADAVAKRGASLDELMRRGDVGPILVVLLDPDGLDCAALPKALLPFHRYPDGSRTAFVEHLLEGAAYAGSAAGTARLHFTVSPEHEAACRTLLEAGRRGCEARGEARLDVGFSHQKRATDTVAVDLDNQPLRGADGGLVLRPGGHGALIENVNELRGDIVFLKTVDNIQPEHRRGTTLDWMRLLTGHLVTLQDALFAHLAALSAAAPSQTQIEAARRFVRATFGADVIGAGAAPLTEALDRPVRVCGMVRNTGEPGGGPFWVRGPDGRTTRQIVESAQVDMDDETQRAVFQASTHFNPVLIACGVRDWRGRCFDLRRFVDESAVFIARKSKDGQELKALERPGLWNGAMAHWHTVFVEVPNDTFTPVKTVNDLLRPEHQPPAQAAIGD